MWTRSLLREFSERDRGPIVLLALVGCVFFLPSFLVPGVLIWPHSGLGSDISYRHWPDLVSYAASWRAGRIALWDPSVALGRPLAGDTATLFLYPLDLAFLVLPPALAFNALDALHVFLAGLFTYWLLRAGFGTARAAALIGGIAFAFSPKLMAHLAGGHVGLVWGLTWAPAVLLGLRLAINGSWLAAALAGLALAVQMPTHIQMPYYTAAVGSAFWAWQVGRRVWDARRGAANARRSLVRLAGCYAVWLSSFVLLAAYVLLPLVELLPYNSRTNFTLEDANRYALPPALLVTLLVPAEFQFPEWTLFVGVLPLALAIIGWSNYSGSRRNAGWFFGLLAAFALIYALGTATPLFGLAFSVIPGFRLLRTPTRFWFFGGLAVAALAGLGADEITHERLRQWLSSRRNWLYRIAGLYGVIIAASLAGYWLLFREWHGQLVVQLIAAALSVALARVWLDGRMDGRVLQWALVPILLIDLLPHAAGYIDLVNPNEVLPRSTPALDYVAGQQGVFRVYSPAGDLPYPVARARGVEALEGLLAFQLDHPVAAIRQATGCADEHYATAIPACMTHQSFSSQPEAQRLGELNVRYVLSRTPLTAPGFKLVMPGSPAVYENELWQERVRLTPRPPLPAEESGIQGRAEILDRAPGEYEVAVTVERPARLVLVETWAPGWQATENGQPLVVERVEGALIGVNLDAGDHTIHFEYAPLGWRVGWPVSLAALIGLAGWVGICLHRRSSLAPS